MITSSRHLVVAKQQVNTVGVVSVETVYRWRHAMICPMTSVGLRRSLTSVHAEVVNLNWFLSLLGLSPIRPTQTKHNGSSTPSRFTFTHNFFLENCIALGKGCRAWFVIFLNMSRVQNATVNRRKFDMTSITGELLFKTGDMLCLS